MAVTTGSLKSAILHVSGCTNTGGSATGRPASIDILDMALDEVRHGVLVVGREQRHFRRREPWSVSSLRNSPCGSGPSSSVVQHLVKHDRGAAPSPRPAGRSCVAHGRLYFIETAQAEAASELLTMTGVRSASMSAR